MNVRHCIPDSLIDVHFPRLTTADRVLQRRAAVFIWPLDTRSTKSCLACATEDFGGGNGWEVATGGRRFRSGGLPSSCAESGALFNFGSDENSDRLLSEIKEMKSVARTVRGLKRLATRTAGAMGEMVMVVMYGQGG
jgi:hypothetical protein